MTFQHAIAYALSELRGRGARGGAKLLRVKQEADSDYHLVLSDTGGRTMIAEIPSPSCIGSSPFLPSIRYVRSKFTAAYHPSEAWHMPAPSWQRDW